MLKVEEWAEIRRLHFAEGLGKQTIAKRLGIARNTVKAALANADPPTYRRGRRPSAVDPYEYQIRVLLKDCPTMPATVIAERISWTRGITILKERVAELRPAVSRVRSLPENRLSPRRACAVGSVAAGF